MQSQEWFTQKQYILFKKKEVHFSLGKRRRFIFVTIEGLRLTKAEEDVALFVFSMYVPSVKFPIG